LLILIGNRFFFSGVLTPCTYSLFFETWIYSLHY